MMSVPNKKPEGGPTATLILDGQEYTLPVIAGTTGDRVIDISNLRQLTGGVTTFDPAFANTASCRSAISWIDEPRPSIALVISEGMTHTLLALPSAILGIIWRYW